MTETPPDQNNTSQNEPRQRRLSRYQKAQMRRRAQARGDQRFYAGIFAIAGFTALLAILLGAIAINGAPIGGGAGMAEWVEDWFWGISKLEAAGLALVAFIALAVYLRMRKRG
ncbi:hypothetical protein [Litorimonas sp.]|jgi:hypothetical protein|uniref:hypothetical protein n=1 Tax=Litorimonas sp. TaxID=1892381 RepID=UPI003A83E024